MARKSPNKADALVYKALQKAIEQDRLRVYLDYARINRPQSPVYDPWECLLPVLVPVIIGLLLIILFLLAEGDDLELVIALGLVLLMGLGDKEGKRNAPGAEE